METMATMDIMDTMDTMDTMATMASMDSTDTVDRNQSEGAVLQSRKRKRISSHAAHSLSVGSLFVVLSVVPRRNPWTAVRVREPERRERRSTCHVTPKGRGRQWRLRDSDAFPVHQRRSGQGRVAQDQDDTRPQLRGQAENRTRQGEGGVSPSKPGAFPQRRIKAIPYRTGIGVAGGEGRVGR